RLVHDQDELALAAMGVLVQPSRRLAQQERVYLLEAFRQFAPYRQLTLWSADLQRIADKCSQAMGRLEHHDGARQGAPLLQPLLPRRRLRRREAREGKRRVLVRRGAAG